MKKTVSEVIKELQSMQEAHGDLPVSITLSVDKKNIPQNEDENFIVSADQLHFGHDEHNGERSDEINIRNFMY
jgi:hypothetical protein